MRAIDDDEDFEDERNDNDDNDEILKMMKILIYHYNDEDCEHEDERDDWMGAAHNRWLRGARGNQWSPTDIDTIHTQH